MKLADKTLETLQTKEIYVDMFTDHYDIGFYGFVQGFNDKYVLLEHYNEDGFYNGIIIFRRQDITRIRWDNNEIKNYSKLITRQENIKKFTDISLTSIESILKSVAQTFGHVSLQIQDINSGWTIIGEIEEIDTETIVIKEFGTMSTMDRAMLMFSIADITRVDAGGIYEMNLLKIHEESN